MVRKRAALVALGLVAAAGAASAGDAQLSTATAGIPTDYRWTGLYVGAGLGLVPAPLGPGMRFPLAAAPTLAVPPRAPPLLQHRDAPRRSLPALSVQGGYNRQLTPGSGVVVGVEVDWTGTPPQSR